MNVQWRCWCRLCASSENVCVPLFSSDNGITSSTSVTDKVRKYLNINVSVDLKDYQTDLPRQICNHCAEVLLQFDLFAEQCVKVQSMFSSLALENSEDEVPLIKETFLNSGKEMKDIPVKVASKPYEEKNYETVQVECDETESKVTSSKRGVKDLRQVRGRGRPRKCDRVVPRIRIRAIPVPSINSSSKNDEQVACSYVTSSNLEKNDEEKTKSSTGKQIGENGSLVGAAKRKRKTPQNMFTVKYFNDDEVKEDSSRKEQIVETVMESVDLKKESEVTTAIAPKKLKKSELKVLVPSLYVFKCHICEILCKSWNSLRAHCKESHDADAQIVCDCGKVLTSRTSILQHRARHTDSYKCHKCEKIFHRQSLLNLHLTSHLPKDEQPFVCCKCARRFHCEALLRNHERVHLPIEERLIYPCHLCQKMFSSKSAVSAHLKAVHFGERPFVCDQCGHSFTSKGILQEHLTIHSDESPWSCTKCVKKFKTKYRLKIHMDTHRETPYQCPKCPVQLSTRRTLRMHLVVHRDTKAYHCTTCGKAFRRAKDLKNHNNLHTGRRPYTCPFCLRTFANGSNCRSHKRRMHPDELHMYEASMSAALGVENNSAGEVATQSKEDSNNPSIIVPTGLKKENENFFNIDSADQISPALFSDVRKHNYQITPLTGAASFLSLTANSRNPDYSQTQTLIRNGFNQQIMSIPFDQVNWSYQTGHIDQSLPSSVSAFPGNPFLPHEQALCNNRNMGPS